LYLKTHEEFINVYKRVEKADLLFKRCSFADGFDLKGALKFNQFRIKNLVDPLDD